MNFSLVFIVSKVGTGENQAGLVWVQDEQLAQRAVWKQFVQYKTSTSRFKKKKIPVSSKSPDNTAGSWQSLKYHWDGATIQNQYFFFLETQIQEVEILTQWKRSNEESPEIMKMLSWDVTWVSVQPTSPCTHMSMPKEQKGQVSEH